MTRPQLIDLLVQDLEPVRPAPSWRSATGGWLAASWLIVGTLILATGPLHADVVARLIEQPLVGAGVVLGILTSVGAIAAGLELAVPGAPPAGRLLAVPALLLAGWLGVLLIDLGQAPGAGALETMMMSPSGRLLCPLQTLLFALPPLSIALVQLDRRIPVASPLAGALIGLAAGLVPAVWMQLACVTDPLHTLTHHLSPLLLLAPLGALAGAIAQLRDRG